jgi:hypothetical protein
MVKSGETKQKNGKTFSNFEYSFFPLCSLWFYICHWPWCSVLGDTASSRTIKVISSSHHYGVISLMSISRRTSVGTMLNCLLQRPTSFASLLLYSFTNYTLKYFNLEWILCTYWTTLNLVQVFRFRTCIRKSPVWVSDVAQNILGVLVSSSNEMPG